MSKRTEHELQIRIGGKVDNSLTQSVNEIKGELGSMGSTIKTVAAAAVTAFASVKVKEAFDDVTDASKEMQTSMAGVAKVVDGLKDDNGKVTKSYNVMKDAILDMSKDLPMTAENIAAIMEAAGQSNIAKDELLEFTETATKMGIAFDSTAEQSGEWMAAWRTALKMNQKEVTDLADQVNYLGNTTSESAVKISEVITRVGSLAGTANVSAASVAAMAASMTKVEADVSATGIKNFTLALAAGDSATKRQHASFDKLGLKAKTVAKNMQMDSQGTIVDVLERINKLSKEEQTSTMKNLFGSESISAIAPMIANLDNLKEQFSKVGDAALYAGSMEKEYIAASSTYTNVDVLTENKIQAMKVQVGDTLVSLSALAAETKGNLAESFGDFVQDHAPEIESTVRNIEKAFSEFLPTAVTNVKEFGKNAMDLIEPVYELIEDNPDLIPNFIVSTGAAMVTYKVGKNIGEIAKNVKAVGSPIKLLTGLITNPWALAIGATAGAIAMIATSVHNARKELREADLASRFGDISLSLKDLDGMAAEMLRSNNFEKISESLDIKEGTEKLQFTIEDTLAEINKLNWKVGIGLDLSEEERASYQNDITSFITDTQQLLDDNQYALSLSLDVLTDDDESGNAIKASAKKFYMENQAALESLGTQLQEAVNNAFSDGLLTIDEVETISNLQKQMSAITSQMAQSKFEATLEVMGTKTLGTDLTSDSFKNYLAEMQEQAQSTITEYDESLTMSIANSKVRLKAGEINKDQYDKEVAEYKKNYLEDIGELNLTVSNFATDTLFQAYGKEMESGLPQLSEILKTVLEENKDELAGLIDSNSLGQYGLSDYMSNMLISQFKKINISKEAKENLLNNYKDLLPTKEELEKTMSSYVEENRDIPSEILEEYNNILMLGALGGDENSIYSLLGSKMGEDEEYREIIKKAGELGLVLPESLINSLDTEIPNITAKVAEAKKALIEEAEKEVNINIPLNINTKSNVADISTIPTSDLYNQLFGKIHHNAKGNIVNEPILTTFAEEGPEAAIPLDGSPRSIDLWYMAGQILGMFNRDTAYGNGFNIPQAYSNISNSSSTNNISSEPTLKIENTYYIENASDIQKVQQVIEKSQLQMQAQFDRMMAQYKKSEGRVNMKQ
ncbi:phage tail tape measure protein [Anaerocolumna sp. AGMB13020]|uniref:phage tail tape measure protein n=1 Tax=Anaerocolumna sp. AGMB13020 TaxID=3081750 RepID=UPI0029547E5F|nr:phage tail tape measure protein [Anaerocolumna sp. AGMB13020]WOO34951.1 phage tail tape measure protein [Anaerocolumna sp. AGMB13020]